MASRPGAVTERPPKHPGHIAGLPISQNTAGRYVQRLKIQQDKIKTLHDGDGDRDKPENSNRSTYVDKSLPKLSHHAIQRNHAGLKKFTRSNTIESFKLPRVNPNAQPTEKKKKPLPVKTFHIKLNPDHASLVSKSMPSLPSIPGSPSVDRSLSPASDYKASAFPAHGKHRYQTFAYRKTIHPDKDAVNATGIANASSPQSGRKELPRKKEKTTESVYNNILPQSQRPIKHRVSVSEPDRYNNDADSSSSFKSSSKSNRSTRSRRSRRISISDTKSESGYFTHKKWKDDCNCLRCQMLRRQYKEGDEHYNLWGQYPCHRVDFSIGLDDDD